MNTMTNFLTKIKAFLYRNPLTGDPNDYIARVEAQRPLSTAQICATAVARGGADVPAKAMEHAVELFFEELEYQLCNGFSVNTKTFTAAPHIKGVFHSPHEPFDPAKHHLLCEFQQGARLRQRLAGTEVVIEGVQENIFYVDRVKDLFTGKTDGTIMEGKVTELRGHNMKVVGGDPTVGIWLRNLVSGEDFHYGAEIIALNEPSRLLLQLPGLSSNVPYELRVTTQYSSSHKLLESPRTAVLLTHIVQQPLPPPPGHDNTAEAAGA
jgi:hypothetical protein